jgi:hypothetical protein
MAKLIHDAENNRCHHKSCRECEYADVDDPLCTEKITAKYLIEENNYRKASEVAREITAEIGERFASLLQMLPAEGKLTDAKIFIEAHWEFIAHSIMFKYDAELKKKYTEGGENAD